MPPTNRRSLSIVSLGAAALLLACQEKKAPPPPPPPEVSVAEVTQRDVAIGGELTATLKGFEDVEIRARVEGYLKSIDYREGSEVKKGAVLFTIDDQPYRAKVAEAKGDLAHAEASLSKADQDVKRYKPLAKKKAIPQADLDNALASQRSGRAQVDAMKAALEKAELDITYTKIQAPMDGLVGPAQRKVGDLVGKGEATLLTTISSVDPIRVTVNIPESVYLKYADRLQESAQQHKPNPDGPQLILSNGLTYPERGWLILIDRAVDSSTGTLRADLAFKNPKRMLRPGLYGKVHYKEDLRKGALLVPQRAVQELQGQFTVVVINAESKAEARRIKIGPREGSLWIVEEGLKPGEKVVVEGVQKARDGMTVKATLMAPEPVPAPPTPANLAPAATGTVPPPAPAPAPPPAASR